MTQTKFWDSIEGRYVERSYEAASAMETFGELMRRTVAGAKAEGRRQYHEMNDHTFANEVVAANDNAPVAAQQERGPYIGTLTGKFWPFDPRPEDVDINHVAHSLAMTCRYTGACIHFYSVAEHSVHIARWLQGQGYSPDVCLAGLLHDAPESLSGFGDNARPSKVKAPIIKETEERIYRMAVAPAFGLAGELPNAVHEADSRIIADEMSQNMRECDPAYNNPLGIELMCWPPYQAEEEFLAAFWALQGMREEVAA